MITIIAALSKNGVIGHQNRLPWHLPEDLKRFRAYTTGNTVIMGRRTFESIGRPLPGRRTVVVSRQRRSIPGVEVAGSLEEALALPHSGEIYIAGGAEIYRQAIDRASRMLLTFVEVEVEGDAFFPKVDWSQWREVDRTESRTGGSAPTAYRFAEFVRASDR